MCGVIDVLKGLLTPAVAAVAVWIAWRQHVNARDRLRLDLYDRRAAIFKGVIGVITKITAAAQVDLDDIRELGTQLSQGRFLFGSDVVEYGEQLRRRAIEYRKCRMDLEARQRSKEPAAQLIEDEAAHLQWFANQYEAAERVFERYLAMRER